MFVVLADAPTGGTDGTGTAVATARRQGTPQSASPVAAWCTVTDRLRRLRADLEVGDNLPLKISSSCGRLLKCNFSPAVSLFMRSRSCN